MRRPIQSPICLLLLLFFYPLFSISQNLSGTWIGNTAKGEFVTLVIIGEGSTYVGYSYDRSIGYCKANFAGHYQVDKNLLKGEGQGFIERTFGHSQGSFRLHFKAGTDADYLTGTVRPKSIASKILSLGIPYFVKLKRVKEDVDTTAFMHAWLKQNSIPVDPVVSVLPDSITPAAPEPVLTNTAINYDSALAVKNQRSSDTLQTIAVKADSIVLTIYDNEIVDGDTVTIFQNNKIVVDQLPVTARHRKVIIPISKADPHHEFIMVAKNVGRIPPNTAMLIIEAGNKRYQLKAASDLTKNALIIFEYRE